MLVRRLLAGETTPLLDALPDLWRGLQLERLVAAEAEGEVLVQADDGRLPVAGRGVVAVIEWPGADQIA